jgi:hypothetical protein
MVLEDLDLLVDCQREPALRMDAVDDGHGRDNCHPHFEPDVPQPEPDLAKLERISADGRRCA